MHIYILEDLFQIIISENIIGVMSNFIINFFSFLIINFPFLPKNLNMMSVGLGTLTKCKNLKERDLRADFFILILPC